MNKNIDDYIKEITQEVVEENMSERDKLIVFINNLYNNNVNNYLIKRYLEEKEWGENEEIQINKN